MFLVLHETEREREREREEEREDESAVKKRREIESDGELKGVGTWEDRGERMLF
jgi:hypothetical protein